MSWFVKSNPIIKSDILEIYNIEKKIFEYEKYFNETNKKVDFDLLKYIETIVKLFNKSWNGINE